MEDGVFATEEERAALLVGVQKIDRDIVRAIKDKKLVLSRGDIRYIVDIYYQVQELRKAAANQERAASGEPTQLVDWFTRQAMVIERQIHRALNAWTETHDVSRWAKSIIGIGPIISAGLAAHIDISLANTAGKLWRYAGQDPTCEWEKKQKRPWNARLKTLCWKIGESFVKVSGNEKSFFGKLYCDRKAQEIERNEGGEFSEQAARELEKKNYRKDTVARKWYTEGKLPPAHIHARAKRYAVKMFLACYHEIAYVDLHGEEPPKPYAIAHLGHADHIRARDVT
jgi:hypothetical protein